jgi:UDP-glucose 4-epimerase
MARILVTGASGRIGLPFVRDLIGRGHVVRALAIPGDPRAAAVADAGAEVVIGTIMDASTCDRSLDGVDAVYHLAGQLPQDASDDAIFETNVRGTWNLLKAAAVRAASLRVVVFASTDDVYSSVDPAYVPVDENHPRRPVSTYGLSKVIGEDIGMFWHVRHGLPFAMARFGLTQLAHEVLDGITAHLFLLSARVESLRRQSADPAVAAQLAPLEKVLAERGEHAIALRDDQGAPWILQLCEVSDLVGGLSLYLDRPAAIGDSFNMGAAAPFATDVAAAHLARLTGMEVLDVAVPGPRLVINESIARARSILGYEPKLTIMGILDQAVSELGADRIRGGTRVEH